MAGYQKSLSMSGLVDAGEDSDGVDQPVTTYAPPTLTSDPSFAQPPMPPPRRPLSSYVSEPPSTLVALSVIAQQEEAAAAAAGLAPSPFSTATADANDVAATPDGNGAVGPSASRRDMAWLHTSPEDAAAGAAADAAAHRRTAAGDLAGMELRQRRGGAVGRTTNVNAVAVTAPHLASLSPGRPGRGAGSVSTAAGATTAPRIERTITRMRSLRRRDVEAIFQGDRSDSDDESEDRAVRAAADGAGPHPWADMDSQLDLEVAEPPKPPFYRRWSFWIAVICVVWVLGFVSAGVALLVFPTSVDSTTFQPWRICFFFAGLPVIWYVGSLATALMVLAVEKKAFTTKNALYFAYAVRKPLRNVIRALLTLGWWPLIMTVNYEGNQSQKAVTAYTWVLKLWACVTLFMTANLLKTLLGKVLALKFNKESHLHKLYTALKKEQWLRCLLQPRQAYIPRGDSAVVGAAPEDAGDDQKLGGTRSASAELVHPRGMERGLSSGISRKLKFWRRNTAPLPAIDERDSGAVSSSGGGGSGGSGKGSETELVGRGAGSAQHLDPGFVQGSGGDVAITIDGEVPIAATASPRGYGGSGPPVSPQRASTAAGKPPGPRSTTLPPLRVPSRPPSAHHRGLSQEAIQTPLVASPLPGRAAIDAAYAARASPKGCAPGGGPSATAGVSTSPHSNLRQSSVTGRSALGPTGVAAFGSEPLRRDEVMQRLAKLERYIRKTELEVTFRDALNNVERSAVTSDADAKRVGLFLFWNVKSDFEKAHISPDDLEDFLPHEDVGEAFAMLDDDGDGAVSVEDCVAAVTGIFQERRNLASSLKDSRSIAASLETVLGVVIHVIFGMIYLFILFAITFTQVWAFVSTVVLGLSFIFGAYIRTVFENTAFLFSTHPFDVGDVLYYENDYLTVDEMQINFTVFVNSAKQRMWVPNQRLVASSFINLTTSGNKSEAIKILVDMDTPPEALDACVAALQTLADEVPQEISGVGGAFRDAAVPMKMTMALWVDLTHSGTNLGRVARIRSRAHIVVAQALKEAGVGYTWPAQRPLHAPARPVVGQAEVEAAAVAAGVMAANGVAGVAGDRADPAVLTQ